MTLVNGLVALPSVSPFHMQYSFIIADPKQYKGRFITRKACAQQCLFILKVVLFFSLIV